MLDVRRLEVLRVLSQQGSMAATAHQLHLTPSAVSQQVRQLSQELDVALVRRDGRGVRLTPEAEILVEHAVNIWSEWEQALGRLSGEHGGSSESVRVAVDPEVLAAAGVPAIVRLASTRPAAAPQVVEALPERAREMLRAGEVDVVAVLAPPGVRVDDDEGLDQEVVAEVPHDLLVHHDHPVAGSSGTTLDRVADEPWIAPPEASRGQQHLQVACAAAGFAPRIRHRARDHHAVCALVGARLGVALLAQGATLPRDTDVVPVPVLGPTARRIVVASRRGGRSRPAVDEAVRALTASAQA